MGLPHGPSRRGPHAHCWLDALAPFCRPLPVTCTSALLARILALLRVTLVSGSFCLKPGRRCGAAMHAAAGELAPVLALAPLQLCGDATVTLPAARQALPCAPLAAAGRRCRALRMQRQAGRRWCLLCIHVHCSRRCRALRVQRQAGRRRCLLCIQVHCSRRCRALRVQRQAGRRRCLRCNQAHCSRRCRALHVQRQEGRRRCLLCFVLTARPAAALLRRRVPALGAPAVLALRWGAKLWPLVRDGHPARSPAGLFFGGPPAGATPRPVGGRTSRRVTDTLTGAKSRSLSYRL